MDNTTTPDVARPTPQSNEDEDEDEGHDRHSDTQPTKPSYPLPVTSPIWQTTLESLLRFPGMNPNISLFRHSNPVLAIASALGATNSAHAVIEGDWVPIAERVFEIQTCCLMHAKHLDFDVASDDYVTWNPTAEWCARVLEELQSKGFRTNCTALVSFVFRTYLQSKSWVRHHQGRGRQRHRQVMETLERGPSTEIIKHCSMIAKGFSAIARNSRKRKIELVQAGAECHQLISDVEEETALKEKSI